MLLQEYVIGFDIRHRGYEMPIPDRVALDYPEMRSPRSYDSHVSPSRFRLPLKSEYPIDPRKTNFREPLYPSPDGKLPVYNAYAERYDYTKLWENLGNMIFRHPLDPVEDVVAAFTLFYFDDPVIYCHDPINFSDKVSIFESIEWLTRYEIDRELITPKFLKIDEWNFLGHEVTAAHSLLEFSKNHLIALE